MLIYLKKRYLIILPVILNKIISAELTDAFNSGKSVIHGVDLM